ncbi:hypothetical protein LTR16_005396 [Cryomyces antarcticus]|uniref:Transcription factor domain-containing protein n=1 Tax=Cryomyces antarcticus TaxID=329879 RepID=A0ABR0M5J7_9PEZI|nr:hypothetical protein LTR16_005396 [Cryomyces antarcticus]
MAMGPPPGAAPSQGQHTSKPPTSSHTAYPRHTSGSQGAHVPSQSGPAAPMQPPPAVPFFGMAPSRPNNSMPASYASGQSQSPSTLQDDHLNDLNAATDAAMDEWTQIRHALNSFASRLGPAFQPLGPEFHQPLATPFGDAVVYRSYDIGCLWAVWHMAVIIAIRSHPSMPPAAMMAAGVAAQQTASMAHEVARIAAGIAPTPRHVPLSPSLGAALVESTMPCFFAGVQYRDAAQRAWIVARILDIEARTGWASAGLIARGCETAWVKAAAGRGPPYERVRDVRHADERINGAWERESEEPPREPSDRRNIHRFAPTRVHWAIGIIGMEEDVARIDLNG